MATEVSQENNSVVPRSNEEIEALIAYAGELANKRIPHPRGYFVRQLKESSKFYQSEASQFIKTSGNVRTDFSEEFWGMSNVQKTRFLLDMLNDQKCIYPNLKVYFLAMYFFRHSLSEDEFKNHKEMFSGKMQGFNKKLDLNDVSFKLTSEILRDMDLDEACDFCDALF